MAKVTFKEGTTKVVVENEPTFVFELSESETQFLFDLLGSSVVGSSTKSRRGISDNIYYAIWSENKNLPAKGEHQKLDLDGTVVCLSTVEENSDG